MTEKEMKAQIEALIAENAKLKEKKVRKISMKIGQKGGVSVYGINSRFPVTLYQNQWKTLLDQADNIRAFIETNSDSLATKE